MTTCAHLKVRELIADGALRIRVCKDCNAPVLSITDYKDDVFTLVVEDHTSCTLCEGDLQLRSWDGSGEIVEVCPKVTEGADKMWRLAGKVGL